MEIESKKKNIIILFTIFFLLQTSTNIMASRCTGSSNCHACTSCRYCKHCNEGGGTCGVCGGGTNNSGPNWGLYVLGIAGCGYVIYKLINNKKDK